MCIPLYVSHILLFLLLFWIACRRKHKKKLATFMFLASKFCYPWDKNRKNQMWKIELYFDRRKCWKPEYRFVQNRNNDEKNTNTKLKPRIGSQGNESTTKKIEKKKLNETRSTRIPNHVIAPSVIGSVQCILKWRLCADVCRWAGKWCRITMLQNANTLCEISFLCPKMNSMSLAQRFTTLWTMFSFLFAKVPNIDPTHEMKWTHLRRISAKANTISWNFQLAKSWERNFLLV